MTDLSPAAQAILDAYQFAPIEDELTAAAVLRAAADQVVPEDYQCSIDINSDEDGGWVNGLESRNQEIRDELLAIAAELEAK
jgi:hypothetical protein